MKSLLITWTIQIFYLITNYLGGEKNIKIRQMVVGSSGKGQAMTGKEWPLFRFRIKVQEVPGDT